MIQNHKIKYENGEQVLYLYLDFSYEFADELGEYTSSVFSMIKKYLNKLKTGFKGTKVVIVVSGIVIASLTLNASMMKQNEVDSLNDVLYITSVHFEEPNIKNEKPEENNEVKQEEKVEEQKEIKKESENKKTTVKKETTKKETTNKSNNSNKTTTTTKQSNSTTSATKKENNKQETSGTIVTVYRSNGQVLKIELEEYLIGVVAGEMPVSFNSEALKAQAVLARTYALKSINQNKKLTDTTSTQVYNDNNELKSKWGSEYSKYYNKVKNAVEATKGITVTHNGKYIEAVYHAISNGYTEAAENVWGNSFSYLKVVDSSLDKNVKGYIKTVTKSYSELCAKFGITVNDESNIEITRNESGRVATIKIDDKSFTGVNFRTKLGLRSTDFDIEKTATGFNITTRGYGHGVGMSQYGANELAKTGKTYKQIISHYYPGTTLKNV